MTAFSPDPQQSDVLAHERGPLLVKGEAGTGKCAVLRERFARLVESGEDPDRVALVLGSMRARAEARDLLFDRVRLSVPGLKVLTIHGLANLVVTSRHDVLAYAEPPQI